MRGNELLNKMALIAPAYLAEAEAGVVPKRKTVWARWGALAACLCLITGVCLIPALQNEPPAPPVPAVPTGTPAPNPDGSIERESEPAVYPPHTILKPGDEGYIAPAETVTPGQTHNSFAPFIGAVTEGADLPNVTPMISHFGETGHREIKPVQNGEVHLSPALRAAMEHYGNSANYRVLVILFRDGQAIPGKDEAAWLETDRLGTLGYIVAMETYGPIDDPAAGVTDFTLHATHTQLEAFPAAGDFGYALMLYCEYFGESAAEDTPVVFNGFAGVN